MKLGRRSAVGSLLFLLFATVWVLWNRPATVNMAANAPADSFAFLECNSLTNVVNAIRKTDAWRTLAPIFQLTGTENSQWTTNFARWTGLAPTSLVVSARAQLAIIVLNVGTSEEDGSLTVKPELAVVIETHTSSWRIKPLAEDLLAKLPSTAYGNASLSHIQKSGTEYLIWSAPAGRRQIVAVIDDTVVLVGNSVQAIEACLAVRRGARPSLNGNVDLQNMYRTLNADQALAFGYVPAAHTARLATLAAPLLLGVSDGGFQQILPSAAAKLLGGIGWVAQSADGAIEDRYMFVLPNPVLAQLRTGFEPISFEDQLLQRLIPQVASATQYRFQNPLAAWRAFDSAMLSQLDAVTAMVFKSGMKSSLTAYGIDDPEEFLKTVGPDIGTLRVTRDSSKSTVVGTALSEDAGRSVVNMVLGSSAKQLTENEVQFFRVSGNELMVAIKGKHLFVGTSQDVHACLNFLADNDQATHRLPKSIFTAAAVRSYADDSPRVKNFFLALTGAIGEKQIVPESATLDAALLRLPMSITESAVSSDGLDRRTRSPLGQLGTIATLLFSQ